MPSNILTWIQNLQAIAQNGLTYTQDPFDIQRYEQVRNIAAELLAAHSNVDLCEAVRFFQNEAGHATPKLDVRGAVFRDDAILLVKEKRDGLWTIPGGWIDINESPADAAVREVYEETGYRTRAVKLVAVYDKNKHPHPPTLFHSYKLFFHCELLGGEPTTNVETEDPSFFSKHKIPELSPPRITLAQVLRLFEHYHHPEWPADFD